MSQYKTIEGIRYSAELLNLATAASGEDGTGKMDMSTVEKMFAILASDNRYSELEKRTIWYIRSNFEFEKDADAHLRKEIRSWAGKRAKRNQAKSPKNTSSSASNSKTPVKVKHFDEYVNEETGEVFDTLQEWGQSILSGDAWSGLSDYLYEYDCEYIVETLDNGTTVESYQDYKRGYEVNRYMYRGCDGKVYGLYSTIYVYEHCENSDFEEFEIREKIVLMAGPKGFTHGDVYRG